MLQTFHPLRRGRIGQAAEGASRRSVMLYPPDSGRFLIRPGIQHIERSVRPELKLFREKTLFGSYELCLLAPCRLIAGALSNRRNNVLMDQMQHRFSEKMAAIIFQRPGAAIVNGQTLNTCGPRTDHYLVRRN